MKRAVWSVAVAGLAVVACGKVAHDPVSVDVPSAGAVTVAEPVAVAPEVPGDSSAEFTPLGVYITARKAEQVKVCAYDLDGPYPGPQRLAFESARYETRVGEVLFVAVPERAGGCQYQVDLVDWRACPASGNPPTFGGGLKGGKLMGSKVCVPPQPTPKPTPSPSPTPSPKPSPKPTPKPTPSPCPTPTPKPPCPTPPPHRH